MRTALGSNAFSSLRSLMLRQQSTYMQQLTDLHRLSRVQEQLMHEMQLQQGSGKGDGAFTQPLQQCQYQPWYSSPFGPEAAYRRESRCCAPQSSSIPHPQARLAHLWRILRSLGNLPKAMRGEVTDASSACPPLPPLPSGLLRPFAESMLLPPDELLGGGSSLSQQQPTVQQREQNSSVLQGRRDEGRVSEESAVGSEKRREEETRWGEGTSRLWRPGDDVDDESWPPGVSVALDKVSWSTWPSLRAKSTAVSHFLPCLKLLYYDSADIATQLAQPWMPPALSSAATATICQLMPPGSSHISMPQVGVSVSGRGLRLRGVPLLIERSEEGRGCIRSSVPINTQFPILDAACGLSSTSAYGTPPAPIIKTSISLSI